MAETDSNFAQECLQAHNEYREKHGVPPLKLNQELCKYSEEGAKRLVSIGKLEQRSSPDYGENVLCITSTNPNHHVPGNQPVDSWYKEMTLHPFGSEPNNLKSCHFSQIVWRDTRELGAAIARGKKGQIYIVVNYSPRGNIKGSFAENVPPLGGFGARGAVPKQNVDTKEANLEVIKIISNPGVENFTLEGLRIHNEYRKKHGVPALKLNDELSSYAENWAKTMAQDGKFRHRPNNKYGENIYSKWTTDPNAKISAKDACDSWYDEIKLHTFGVEPKALKSGHFTQMIWKSSEELGMGQAKNTKGNVYIVANYNPKGNIIGKFAENVPKLL